MITPCTAAYDWLNNGEDLWSAVDDVIEADDIYFINMYRRTASQALWVWEKLVRGWRPF